MSDVVTSGRLFTPVKLGPLELRNRTIRAAAFEGMCPDGLPSESLLRYHRSVAAGGVGMTTVAYASVTPTGRTFSHQLHMHDAAQPGLRRLTDAVHAEGAAASIQLGHCGNMADTKVNGQRPMAPSARLNLFGLALPRAMTAVDIEQLVQDFGRAVRLAREAGFDAVELQAGHGYLISQFLSPFTNRRKDQWGGSPQNRARLLLDVLEAAQREAAGRVAVVVKMNLCDGFSAGQDQEEGVEVARLLDRYGADALVLSGGFVSKCPMYILRGEVPLKELTAAQPELVRRMGLVLFGRLVVKAFPFEEAYFRHDALRVRQAVELPLIMVGGLRSLESMERALAEGFDALALGRPLIREPGFVARLQAGDTRPSLCEPCNKCMATMYYGEATCPELEQELEGERAQDV